MPTSLLQQVIEMVANEMDLKTRDIQADSSFVNDLMADSLDTANLLYASKVHFGVNISNQEADNIDTVQDLADVITRLQDT